MSLKLISIRDLDAGTSTFINRLQANSPDLGSDDSFHIESVNKMQHFYHHAADQLWSKVQGGGLRWARMDPLLATLDHGPGTLNEVYPNVTAGGPFQDQMFVGEHNRDTGVQRVYGIDTFSFNEIRHVSLSAPFTFASPEFNQVAPWRTGGVGNNFSSGAAGVQGYRPSQTAGVLVFESAEQPTWPAGYALMIGGRMFDDAGAGLLEYNRVLCKVDLSQAGGPPGGAGKAEIVPTAAWYAGTIAPLHPTAHAGPLGGFDVWFDELQFDADDDSTVTAPKGRLFMFNRNDSDSHRSPSGPASAGTIYRKFVKIIEWNPTDKSPAIGEINRVHLRELAVTLMTFIEETAIGSGGIGTGTGGVANAQKMRPFFHPPSNTLRMFFNNHVGFSSGDGDSIEQVFAITAAVDAITTPTAVSQPETGKSVRFESIALGDLGELISGVDVDWTLDRRSTVDEVLLGTVPAGTVAVANFPIDGLSATDNSLVVKEGGVVLTEGVDYTVVLNTGAITGIGGKFQVGLVYTASYEHVTTPTNPPHGILRTLQSKTDASGRAIAIVEAADDDSIIGEFDGIGSSEAP